MKRLKTFGLAGCVILFLLLAACAGGGGSPGTSPNDGPAPTKTEAPPPQPTETDPPADNTEVRLLIHEADDVRIYYRDFVLESVFGPQLLVRIENGMSIDINIYLFDLSVNGREDKASAYISVPPGDASDYSLFILNANYDDIKQVEKIEFFLDIMNAEEDYRHVTAPITIDVLNPGA